ncbi:MAG: TIM44-like domain-containing protein [Hyphomicrobiales bacterium]|nr:TIM44-like domain-containing protein [Hyphomicrobiales bacterium]
MEEFMSFRKAAIFVALAAALAMSAGEAYARAGGGFSSGSRGGRTFSMPSATPTAPRSAAPFDRSMTPQSGTPGLGAGMGARPGWFSSGGFGRGLLGGLLGAGLMGMLLGHGFFGGIGGLFSLFGLLIQIALVVLVVRWLMGLFRGGRPAYAGAPGGPMGGASSARTAPGPIPGGAPPQPVQIAGADFDAFEKRLGDVQAAYSAEDLGALGRLATPEMVAYFRDEIAANSARGLVNRIGDVKLLQGDLSEAWREGTADYATVAMRFQLTDAMVERATGRVASGSTTNPEQAVEYWTFRRPAGAGPDAWILSAIQQAR